MSEEFKNIQHKSKRNKYKYVTLNVAYTGDTFYL